MNHETESQTRLRRAKEALENYQAAEAEARKALHHATESTKRAREKYSELFHAEENRVRERLIKDYNHCTK